MSVPAFLKRTEILIGREGVKKLQTARVAVFGAGGVGGFAAEMLIRAGIGHIKIVDFDRVDVTNINRQIIALPETVGRLKAQVLAERLSAINPEAAVEYEAARYEKGAEALFGSAAFIADCIDSLPEKADLIAEALTRGIKTVSAMGAGNRTASPDFKPADIFATSGDGLARKLRKLLRERGVTSAEAICSSAPAEKPDTDDAGGRVIGSISYSPAACGCAVAARIITLILEEKETD